MIMLGEPRAVGSSPTLKRGASDSSVGRAVTKYQKSRLVYLVGSLTKTTTVESKWN